MRLPHKTYILHLVLCTAIAVKASLTSVNHSRHVIQLYQKLQNEDPPSGTDLAVTDVQFRKRICADITNSGFFHFVESAPINEEEVYHKLRYHPLQSSSVHQDYCYNCPFHYFAYKLPYQKREFDVAGGALHFQEYVFACPLKHSSVDGKTKIVTYYITKEYNVAPFPEGYLPGRFIFGRYLEPGELNYIHDHMLLAEEPAIAYTDPNFNVELHYLSVRARVQPAKDNDTDPLCKLITESSRDPDNQHYRLCVAVLRSTYFKHAFAYPGRASTPCRMEKLSFRTPEAIEKVAQLSEGFYERMTLCHFEFHDSNSNASSSASSYIFISRAYQSNRILVYRLSSAEDGVYLDNVSFNISIVDELDSFNFPE